MIYSLKGMQGFIVLKQVVRHQELVVLAEES